MNNRRLSLCSLFVVACGAAIPPAHGAADAPAGDREELNAETRRAIDRGLAWLAKEQSSDGSYGSDSHYGRHVGITGLAGLAFLAGGSTPGRGPYGENVSRCIDFILSNAAESGLLAAETSHGPMYGHGFATLFLAEVYGMSPRPDLEEALRRAIRLIVMTQNDQGGWRYQPVRYDADISVTVCELMALRAARNAGVYVPKDVIDKATFYIRESQNPDGGFRYMLNTGASAFARSAAAVAALQYAGVYHGDEVARGLKYVSQFRPGSGDQQNLSHYYYGHYYAVQAMFVAGGDHWMTWWPSVRDELVSKQDPEHGSWRGQAGEQYGTAMALIVLQVPNRLLPIFQK